MMFNHLHTINKLIINFYNNVYIYVVDIQSAFTVHYISSVIETNQLMLSYSEKTLMLIILHIGPLQKIIHLSFLHLAI